MSGFVVLNFCDFNLFKSLFQNEKYSKQFNNKYEITTSFVLLLLLNYL